MFNFNYYNPVKILLGEGNISNIAKEIPQNANVLITYGGGSIKRNGVYDEVIEALKDHKYEEFGGIEANPQFSTLMKAVEIVRTKNIDFLLAVGGGSVLDGTKFIAAAAPFEGNEWDICKKRIPITNAVSLGAILTIPATGSEMNSGGVVSRKETKEKLVFGGPVLFPKFSVLDPKATRTLPKIQRANGVVDAYVHIMEQYATYDANAPVQTEMAEGLLRTLISIGERYVENPDDMDTASNLIWTATMALNGLIGTGVPHDWSTHMIGHELTALHGIDHAQTLAIVMSGVLKEMMEGKKEKLLMYATNVWRITEGSDEEKIHTALEKTDEFFESLGIKTRLSDYDVDKASIDIIANRFKERNIILGERKDITPEKITTILNGRW
ncbi:MAG: iron-containing alcohol dehydrogenase [Hyphomicrobiales bacterium]